VLQALAVTLQTGLNAGAWCPPYSTHPRPLHGRYLSCSPPAWGGRRGRCSRLFPGPLAAVQQRAPTGCRPRAPALPSRPCAHDGGQAQSTGAQGRVRVLDLATCARLHSVYLRCVLIKHAGTVARKEFSQIILHTQSKQTVSQHFDRARCLVPYLPTKPESRCAQALFAQWVVQITRFPITHKHASWQLKTAAQTN